MNGLVPQKLVVGTRLAIKNQVFEVTFVDAVNVRYASCAGGRVQMIPTTTFWEYVDSGVIGFLDKSQNLPSIGSRFSLPYLNEAEQKEMHHRYKFVHEAMQSPRSIHSLSNLKRAIDKITATNAITNRPGKSTVSRWIQRYVSSGCDITSLAPRHAQKGLHQKRFPTDIEHLICVAIQDDYLSPARPSVKQVHANIIGRALEYGVVNKEETLPSIRTIHRRVNELDPYIHALKRHGKRYADLRFRAAGSSTETSRLMELVMMDGHRMDIIVMDEETGEVLGRPFLVCLFDVHTRAVVGWHISLIPFCATTALAAIKDMCRRDPMQEPGGVPEVIVTDNGPDLVSNALRNLCAKLAIHIQSSKTYCPDDKAFLERFFRTLCTQLVHMLSGTTFSSPTQRGDYDSEENAVITLDDLRRLFKKWLEETYHKSIHSTTHRAPALDWRDNQAHMPIRFHSSEELDAIARISYKRKINNGRVIVDNLAYKSDALATLEMRNQKDVIVMVDELNLEFVFVSPDGQPQVMIRADCVKQAYSKGLTKYEHEKVQENLAKLSQKDRDELGIHAEEIARWRLWKDIHKLSNSKSARQLKSLGKQHATSTKKHMEAAVLSAKRSTNASMNEAPVNDVRQLSHTLTADDFQVIELKNHSHEK